MEKNTSYMAAFLKAAERHAYKVALSAISGIVRSVFMLLPTIMIQKIINGILSRNDIADFLSDSMLYLLFPTIVLLLYVADTWMSRFVFDIIKDIRLDAIKKIARQPVGWVRASSHQELYNKVIQSSLAIADFYFSTLSNLIWYSTTIAIGFLLMLRINFLIAFILLFISLLQVALIQLLKSLSKKANELKNETSIERDTIILDSINHSAYIRILGLNGQVERMNQHWSAAYRHVINKQLFNNSLADAIAIFGELMRMAILLFFSQQASVEGKMNVGDIYAMNAYITWMTPVFFGLQRWFVEYFASRNDQERIADMLLLPKMPAKEGKRCLPVKTLALSNVAFQYNKKDERPLLQKISVSCKVGEAIVILGPSGCGKSTLVNLLLHFEKCSAGSIRMNHILLEEYDESSFRKQVLAAAQETELLEASLRKNLALSGSCHTDEEILKLLESMGLKTLVDQLPSGLDTIVSRDQVAFSDGEKKRIGIARVLLSEASVLIFDEPAASLDQSTKLRIADTIRRHCSEKILVMVTHDMDLVRDGDKKIFVGGKQGIST